MSRSTKEIINDLADLPEGENLKVQAGDIRFHLADDEETIHYALKLASELHSAQIRENKNSRVITIAVTQEGKDLLGGVYRV